MKHTFTIVAIVVGAAIGGLAAHDSGLGDEPWVDGHVVTHPLPEDNRTVERVEVSMHANISEYNGSVECWQGNWNNSEEVASKTIREPVRYDGEQHWYVAEFDGVECDGLDVSATAGIPDRVIIEYSNDDRVELPVDRNRSPSSPTPAGDDA